jgi:hypothetical protein
MPSIFGYFGVWFVGVAGIVGVEGVDKIFGRGRLGWVGGKQFGPHSTSLRVRLRSGLRQRGRVCPEAVVAGTAGLKRVLKKPQTATKPTSAAKAVVQRKHLRHG